MRAQDVAEQGQVGKPSDAGAPQAAGAAACGWRFAAFPAILTVSRSSLEGRATKKRQGINPNAAERQSRRRKCPKAPGPRLRSSRLPCLRLVPRVTSTKKLSWSNPPRSRSTSSRFPTSITDPRGLSASEHAAVRGTGPRPDRVPFPAIARRPDLRYPDGPSSLRPGRSTCGSRAHLLLSWELHRLSFLGPVRPPRRRLRQFWPSRSMTNTATRCPSVDLPTGPSAPSIHSACRSANRSARTALSLSPVRKVGSACRAFPTTGRTGARPPAPRSDHGGLTALRRPVPQGAVTC